MNNLILLLVAFNFLKFSTGDQQEFPWNQFVNLTQIKDFSNSLLPNYVNFEQDLLHNSNISEQCRTSIKQSLEALHQRQSWAVKLFNSWAKFPPTGTLIGTLTDFGDYDQCLGYDDEQTTPIELQYCLADFELPMPRPTPIGHNYFHKIQLLPATGSKFLNNGSVYRELEKQGSTFFYAFVKFGICIPALCSKADTEVILNKSIGKFGLKLVKSPCEVKESSFVQNFNSVQIGAIAFLILYLLLTLIAGIVDSNFKSINGKLRYLLWFSPQRNAAKILSTSSSQDGLSCLNGLRVLSIGFVVVGHTLDWNNYNVFRNSFQIPDRLTDVWPQFLYRFQLAVDTFFFMSGLLTSYITLKHTKGLHENFNSKVFLIIRYIRLTPQLIAYILLTLILPSLFNGPLWKSSIAKIDYCYNNWWLNFLYIQNVIDLGHICALHTWYLAADMQLHWLSLLPMIVLLKNRRAGLLLTKWLILIFFAVTSVYVYLKRFPPGNVVTSKNDFLDEHGMPSDYLQFVYQSWPNATVFLIGFLMGDYIVHNSNSLSKIKLSKITQTLLWILSIVCFLFSIYSTYPWIYGAPYKPLWSAILFPLNLLTWATGLTIGTWLCITGNGGPIGRFLSAPIFGPLSKMTYSVYLVHSWVVWVANGSRRELLDIRMPSLMLHFAGVVFATFVIGFIFTVLFESPVIHLIYELKRHLMSNEQRDKNNSANQVKLEFSLIKARGT